MRAFSPDEEQEGLPVPFLYKAQAPEGNCMWGSPPGPGTRGLHPAARSLEITEGPAPWWLLRKPLQIV